MGNNVHKVRPVSTATYVWAAVIAATIGFAAVYVSRGRPDNAALTGLAGDKSGAAAPHSGSYSRLSTGEMTAFVFKKAPETLPQLNFVDGEGKARTLADWKGRVVLLNLWATWCAPCRKEMPSLERLQKALGSDKFEVVALGVDRGGVEATKKFLAQIKVAGLRVFADETMRTTSTLRAVGMPTTLLIDGEGREIGRLVGPAEWDSADAKRLIEAQLR
jgi:thiol-disulfide isomerase/thioredoxin